MGVIFKMVAVASKLDGRVNNIGLGRWQAGVLGEGPPVPRALVPRWGVAGPGVGGRRLKYSRGVRVILVFLGHSDDGSSNAVRQAQGGSISWGGNLRRDVVSHGFWGIDGRHRDATVARAFWIDLLWLYLRDQRFGKLQFLGIT